MSQNVQEDFLNDLKKNKVSVTVFLINGVKLQGIITWFDENSLLLRRDGHTQAHLTNTPSRPYAEHCGRYCHSRSVNGLR